MKTHIEKPDDPRIAVFLGLRDQEARKLRELPGGDMAGFFIAEGDLVIDRALAHGYRLHAVLLPEARENTLPDNLPDRASVFLASDAVLTAITGRPNLRDTLSAFVRPQPNVATDLLRDATTVAVLENVNNPNNLGVIIRNAAGLGIDGVLLDPRCGDPLYRRAIRASMGQVFTIPHARLAAFPEGLDALHDQGFTTVALTPVGDTDIREVEASDKVAVLLGAEGPGLEESTLSAASVRARIQMSNDVDSLNVANAAAIAFHELCRRR